ncbi:MAG: quinone oxidoreductase [Ignavibacteriaceae bacterium]|nr:quinone oxidoreductase [Ignavibacteriaceae bacterium]
MKAIVLNSPVPPEGLIISDIPKPVISDGYAIVRNEYAGINYIDTYHRSGQYNVNYPFIPGKEAAGVIDDITDNPYGLRKGDRVVYAGIPGAYAEFSKVHTKDLVRIPDFISSSDAAAMFLQGMTAHYLCYSAFPLSPGKSCLIHAGAGGVGLILNQMALALGAEVYTTVSTELKADLLKSLGVKNIINYEKNDFVAELMNMTGGKKLDVVYDSVGKSTFLKSLDCLNVRGWIVIFGQSSGAPDPVDPQLLNKKGSLIMTRPKLDDYIHTREELESRSSALFELFHKGVFRLMNIAEYPIDKAPVAHKDLESRGTMGKLLLKF